MKGTVTSEEEELLWSKGFLSSQCPEAPNSDNVACFEAVLRITRLPGAPRHARGRYFTQQRQQMGSSFSRTKKILLKRVRAAFAQNEEWFSQRLSFHTDPRK